MWEVWNYFLNMVPQTPDRKDAYCLLWMEKGSREDHTCTDSWRMNSHFQMMRVKTFWGKKILSDISHIIHYPSLLLSYRFWKFDDQKYLYLQYTIFLQKRLHWIDSIFWSWIFLRNGFMKNMVALFVKCFWWVSYVHVDFSIWILLNKCFLHTLHK